MVGTVLGALAVGIAWAMAGGWLARSATGVAWCVVLVVVSYAVFLRPCVVVDERGVEVRNILRDVVVPWRAVAGAGSSWSLVVDTQGGPVTSWAISGTASPGRDALLRRRRAGVGVGAGAGQPRFGAGNAADPLAGATHVTTVDAAGVAAGLVPPALGTSAAAIAALIERLAGDRNDGSGRDAAQARVVWSSVALLVLAALAVPLAALL